MRLLHAALFVFGVPLLACSNDDSATSPGQVEPAQQPPATKFEAGAPCLTSNDCQSGLVCLYPAPGCQNFQVCTTPPPTPCDKPQVACSCLAETVQVCDGYAVDPIDSLGACEGGVILPDDAGVDDASISDSAPSGGNDASDSSSATDASDASDATME